MKLEHPNLFASMQFMLQNSHYPSILGGYKDIYTTAQPNITSPTGSHSSSHSSPTKDIDRKSDTDEIVSSFKKIKSLHLIIFYKIPVGVHKT